MSAQAEASVILSLVDKVTGPIKRLSARISASLSAISKRLGFDKLTRSLGNVGKAFRGLGSGIARTSARLSGLLAVAGLGSGGAIAVMLGLSKSTAEAGKQIENLSRVAGIGPIAFQKWTYAGKMVGLESEKIADILKDVNDKIGDYFQNGSGPMKDFFENMPKKVGKSAAALKKEFRGLSSAEALQLYVSTLEKANLSQAEMTFYMEAIASDATLMLPLLKNGGRELRRYGDEAGRSGSIMGKSAIELGKRFNESLAGVSYRFEGFKNFLGVQLMPVAIDLANAFTKWYDANQKLIRQKVGEWAKMVRKFFKDLLDPTSDLRKKIDELVASFRDAYGKIKPFVDFLGGPLKAGLAVIALWALAPAITAVSLLALAFLGLGKAIAGIALKGIGLALAGLTRSFGKARIESGVAGGNAGRAFGNSFSRNLKKAMRLGIAGLGAWAAYELIRDLPDQITKLSDDPEERKKQLEEGAKKREENEGRLNKVVMDNGGSWFNNLFGTDFFREKDDFENSPANKVLQGFKNWFKPDGGERAPATVQSVLAIADATRAREAGFGRTTENLPGKSKDDIVANNPPSNRGGSDAKPNGDDKPSIAVAQNQAPAANPPIITVQDTAPVVNETKTVNAPMNVNLTIHSQQVTPGQIQAVVQGVMRKANDDHAAGVSAALSD